MSTDVQADEDRRLEFTCDGLTVEGEAKKDSNIVEMDFMSPDKGLVVHLMAHDCVALSELIEERFSNGNDLYDIQMRHQSIDEMVDYFIWALTSYDTGKIDGSEAEIAELWACKFEAVAAKIRLVMG